MGAITVNLVKVDLQLVNFMEQEHEVIEIAVVSSLYDAGLQVEKSIPKESPPPPPPPFLSHGRCKKAARGM